MGAYEAGFLYYVVEAFKAAPQQGTLSALAGASAGSINALLSAIESCSPPQPNPHRSLLWTAWVDLDGQALLTQPPDSSLALFSRRELLRVAESIKARFVAGLNRGCRRTLGITLTRTQPRWVQLDPQLPPVPQVRERVVVSMGGRGPGRLPTITHAPELGSRGRALRLALDGADDDFSQLRDAVLASAAFPVAFAPYSLRVCTGSASAPCTRERASMGTFIDGGVFENQPLSLAMQMFRAQTAPARERAYIVLDPTYSPASQQGDSDQIEQSSVVGFLRRFVSAFVNDARSRELADALHHDPKLGERLRVPQRHFPAVSEALFGFFGFLERGFRSFDFTLGMVEARWFLLETLGWPESRLPERHILAEDWRPFLCSLIALRLPEASRHACRGRDLHNHRILLQLIFEQRHERCLELPASDPATRQAWCLGARRGDAPSRIAGIGVPPGAWRRASGENDFQYAMRRLSHYGYRFSGIGGSTVRASSAERRIRRALGLHSHHLADSQPNYVQRRAVTAATEFALNETVRYQPAAHIVYLGLGFAWQLTYGWAPTATPLEPLRLTLGTLFTGLTSLASTGDTGLSLGIVGGLEFESVRLSRALLQWRFGARGGYGLALTRRSRSCDSDVEPATHCNRALVSSYLAVTLAEAIRLQLEGLYLPPLRASQGHEFALVPSLGLQLWAR